MIVYIGIGSNLGDRERNLKEAISRMSETSGIVVLRASPFYETEPVGGPPQPKYLNGAVALESDLPPRRLLRELQRIEVGLGRVRNGNVRWGPRTIDLDILLYGDEIIDAPELSIPHPLMHERRFVLLPLADIARDVEHPVLKLSISDLLAGQTE